MSALDTLIGAVGETIRPDDRVLELGCGAGRLTGEIAARAAHVIAFDPHPEAIDRTFERHGAIPNLEVVEGDGETLEPVEDRAVDLVLAHGFFRRLASVKAQLGYVVESGRVLAPGGRAVWLLNTDPAPPAEDEAGPRASRRDLLRGRGRAQARRTPFVPLDALGAAALQGGLELERIEGSGTKDTIALAVRASRGA